MSDDMTENVPQAMHLLFENGLFLGAFMSLESAQMTKDGRIKAGKPKVELHTFIRADRFAEFEAALRKIATQAPPGAAVHMADEALAKLQEKDSDQ
jgi:hypothetical protein